ncbi:hypothetical protein CHS0354_008329 [Potamilus streckersoni]|uniref:Uncharacterized protein n=1 Tax=Potamilus streckersoni TaxID=2493646 RepID=A0AAE0SC09_9BIVA|nr:hypothetical protein CHS0354_008329 [Potamilus streckersoni]
MARPFVPARDLSHILRSQKATSQERSIETTNSILTLDQSTSSVFLFLFGRKGRGDSSNLRCRLFDTHSALKGCVNSARRAAETHLQVNKSERAARQDVGYLL